MMLLMLERKQHKKVDYSLQINTKTFICRDVLWSDEATTEQFDQSGKKGKLSKQKTPS